MDKNPNGSHLTAGKISTTKLPSAYSIQACKLELLLFTSEVANQRALFVRDAFKVRCTSKTCDRHGLAIHDQKLVSQISRPTSAFIWPRRMTETIYTNANQMIHPKGSQLLILIFQRGGIGCTPHNSSPTFVCTEMFQPWAFQYTVPTIRFASEQWCVGFRQGCVVTSALAYHCRHNSRPEVRKSRRFFHAARSEGTANLLPSLEPPDLKRRQIIDKKQRRIHPRCFSTWDHWITCRF